MASGHPLDDIDREPWLKLIRNTAEHVVIEMQAESRTEGRSGVVAGCSALKRYYRDILRGLKAATKNIQPPDHHLEHAKPSLLTTYFVFIDGPEKTLMDRMEKRTDHFMKASMLDSQLRTLETPIEEEGVVAVSLDDTTDLQVTQALDVLSRFPDFMSWLDKGNN
jgi:gluconokinase